MMINYNNNYIMLEIKKKLLKILAHLLTTFSKNTTKNHFTKNKIHNTHTHTKIFGHNICVQALRRVLHINDIILMSGDIN